MDYFITHWLAQENALLYQNNGRLSGGAAVYGDVADQYGLGAIALDFVGWGTALLDYDYDYDYDGRPALVVANGSTMDRTGDPTLLEGQRMLLSWNDHPRGFFEMGAAAGEAFSREMNGRGLAIGDIDGDGKEDILVQVQGGKALLLHNEGRLQIHWRTVTVRGKRPNRFGLGALARIQAGGKTQIRQVGSQPSYLSTSSLDAHIGVGAASCVESVEVRFPDGTVRLLRDVVADRRIVVEEE